jgi:hypothetical protein
LCQLCKREQEIAAHLLFKCRFTTRIWSAIRDWVDVLEVDIAAWGGIPTVKVWWKALVLRCGHSRKAISSLIMLVSWEVWKERNARVFQHVCRLPNVLVKAIKAEARLWAIAGATHLSSIMPQE